MLRTIFAGMMLALAAWPAISAIDRRPATAGETAELKSGALACADKGEFDHAFQLVHERDKEAYVRYVKPLAASGRCIFLDAGDHVFVEDTAPASGAIKVRRKGDPSAYWTARGAIDNLP